jgi:cytochrome c biogenesis protein CcdA
LFIATVGFSMGLDGGVFRYLGAAVLLGFGAILLYGPLQDRLSLAVGSFGAVIRPLPASLVGESVAAQFLRGLSLGLVWSPCVGPTLGAASLMAAQRNALPEVGATMALFAIGSTLPLLALGRLSSRISANSRGSLLALGHRGKIALSAGWRHGDGLPERLFCFSGVVSRGSRRARCRGRGARGRAVVSVK